jgi:glycosyltransferase involved in cell wall biosynthesis
MRDDDSRTIVHVIGALAAGGAERFVASLLENMRSDGLAVSLWTLSSRTDSVGQQMRSQLAKADIPVHSGPTVRVGLSTLLWYAQRLHRDDPSIVHLHTPNTELAHRIASLVSLRRPAIFRTLHSTLVPRGLLTRFALGSNRAECSIACSDATLDAYDRVVRGRKLTIRNAVQFPFPVRDPEASAKYKRALRLETDAYHFVHIGRMAGDSLSSAPKAHDVLLRAWRMSGLGTAGAVLHLLGDGPLRSELQQLAGADDSIRFHGIRADVAEWLVAADCLVMPSRLEGLPLVGIEAVGCGLPCVFSDIPPLRELHPPLAYWAAPDDASQLAEQMRWAVRSKGELPLPRDVESFRERFDISKTARKYVHCYASLGRDLPILT